MLILSKGLGVTFGQRWSAVKPARLLVSSFRRLAGAIKKSYWQVLTFVDEAV